MDSPNLHRADRWVRFHRRYLCLVVSFALLTAVSLRSFWMMPALVIQHDHFVFGAALHRGRVILFFNTHSRSRQGGDTFNFEALGGPPEILPDQPWWSEYLGPGPNIRTFSVIVHYRILGIESRTSQAQGGVTHEQFLFPILPVWLIMAYLIWRFRPRHISNAPGFEVMKAVESRP